MDITLYAPTRSFQTFLGSAVLLYTGEVFPEGTPLIVSPPEKKRWEGKEVKVVPFRWRGEDWYFLLADLQRQGAGRQLFVRPYP